MGTSTSCSARIRRPALALKALLLWVWAPALIVVLGFALLPANTGAQSGPTVTDGGVENTFPDGMTFRMNAQSAAPIEEIRFRYEVLPDGTSANEVPDFEPGESVNVEVSLAGDEFYLPPGVVIEYYWDVTDADGETTETEVQSFFYDDVRFDWEAVEGGGVTFYHYSGDADAAGEMHAAAVEIIEQMSGLLQTDIPFPVQVWLYASKEDMRPALRDRSEAYESRITTAGVRASTNTVLVLALGDSIETMRHELTHVVTAEAGESALGTMPSWLDEGTAVYGESGPGGFGDAIEQAIDRGNVLSVREISAYPGDPNKVNLFYGESWSIVKYLVGTYGEDDFAQLFAEIKGGKRIDSALEAVYGFDQDGLDAEWRDANGLPPRETPEPTAEDQRPRTDAADNGGGTSTGPIVGVAVAILALAALVGVGGVLLGRRLS